MRSLVVSLTVLFTSGVFSETHEPHPMGIEVGDGLKTLDGTMGRKIVYGDEDITIINEAIIDLERISGMKSKVALLSKRQLQPLAPQDVKCLMSTDKYCSMEMKATKNILVQALKDDCKSCTQVQKENAGRVIAAMMAYDPVAWKLFLTRYALLYIPKTKRDFSKKKLKELRLMSIGDPEEILNSKYRNVEPGFKVRVKRYYAVKL